MTDAYAVHASSLPCVPTDPDDFIDLVAELIADEGMTEIEASSQAVYLVDELEAFAAIWDSWAFLFGNDMALL